jgi:ubiquinone/menaquinone biosynthesis C-methylase UbiE
MKEAEENAKLNEKKWDLEAEKYDDKYKTFFIHPMQEKIVSVIDLKENQRLLDVGCGTGRALRYASNLVNGQGEFYGIDLSAKMIEISKAKASGYDNMLFYKANAEKLPFADNFFNLIMCSNSFHHYYNPDIVLNEMYRVLQPKGRIYILDGTTDGIISRIIDSLARKIEKGHVKMYSTREYREFFNKTGLKYVGNVSVWFFTKVHIGEK